jgi:hypothetical protein
MVDPQRLTVLHNLLHAVTFHKSLMVNALLCYINDNVAAARKLRIGLVFQFTSAIYRVVKLLPALPHPLRRHPGLLKYPVARRLCRGRRSRDSRVHP